MPKSQFPRNQVNEYLPFYIVATEEKLSGQCFRERNASDYASLTRFWIDCATAAVPHSSGRYIFPQTPVILAVMFHLPPLLPSLPYFINGHLHLILCLSLTWDTPALELSHLLIPAPSVAFICIPLNQEN